MSQDGLFYFDSNNTAQGGPRLIRVSPSNPLPVNTGAGGGTQNVNLTQVGGSPITLGAAVTSAAALPVTIAQDVTMPITGSVIATFGAGSNIIGKVGIDQTTPGTTNGVQSLSGSVVSLNPATSGGLSFTSTIVANNTTAIVIKGSAGQLYGIMATNNSANIAYIKIYNATSATAGSGTPVDRVMIPGPSGGGGGGIVWHQPNGVAYSTGITFIVTGGIADADTTAPAANTFLVTFYYK